MSNFRTTFAIPKGRPFDHNNLVMLCGSCFVENIGEKLQHACFKAMINPHGILFNPISLAHSLKDMVVNNFFQKEELVFHNGLFYSFFHHSRFSHPDAGRCIEQINEATEKAHDFLKKSDRLIITLGTAWVYRHKERDCMVSSCHKIPQEYFFKELLSVEQTVSALSKAFRHIFRFRPDIEIILTISPVRHIKDGMIENQQSKAVLILAAKQLCADFENVTYFLAYELLTDDLRDYRFYAEDLIHPSPTAVQYIWERFCETYFEPETRKVIAEAENLFSASRHRPFHPDSKEYDIFCNKNFKRAMELALHFPSAEFEKIALEFLRK